jgi:integrase
MLPLRRAGQDPEYIKRVYDLQARLGHTSVKTTEIYLQYLTPEEVQTAKFGRTVRTENAVQQASGIKS